jgi:glutathionylspermidine synthase
VTADPTEYARLAERLTATGILSDPWLDGRPRFRVSPIVLDAATDRALTHAAESFAAVTNEVALLCAGDPSLLDRYFGLTPFQRLMWDASAPLWHGIARADVFRTADGPAVCELNCDTPSGEAEAVLLNPAVARQGLADPSRLLGARFCDLIATLVERIGRRGPLTVGIIYPTELVEDLSMIVLYQRWFEARGWRVVLGSPFNLRRAGTRGAALFDVPCDVFVRHYKTDWWGERLPVWDDEDELPDREPLVEPLRTLLGSALASGCAVVNPFGSVVTQNKRAMALMWEELARFPSWAQDAIRAYVPFTARLEKLSPDELRCKDEWVLKSDYGCEGTEVIVGAETSDEVWRQSLAHAIPRRWIAQRYFRALADEEGAVVNHGVYVVGGVASGYLSRVHRGATDCHALTAPTLIEVHT